VSAALGIGTWLWVAAATASVPIASPSTAAAIEAPARVRVEGRTLLVMPAYAGVVPEGALRVRVLVEPRVAAEADAFVATVEEVLADPDGWAKAGRTFAIVAADADIDVVLARPDTVDRLCAPLVTGGSFSCGRRGRAVINVLRWRHGAATFGFAKDIAGYRQYVVNHEVGHLLGFDHEGCPGRGRRAPIMLQQTKSLAGCRRSTRPDDGEIARLGVRLSRRP
jgi:hypothetical protein